MELLVVLLLIALLASIVTPVVTRSIQRAKESTLKEDLFIIRRAIDDYYADKAKYPSDLAILVEDKYIRSVPIDPFTDNNDTWELVFSNNAGNETGIIDIHSGSMEKSNEGTDVKQW